MKDYELKQLEAILSVKDDEVCNVVKNYEEIYPKVQEKLFKDHLFTFLLIANEISVCNTIIKKLEKQSHKLWYRALLDEILKK